LAPAVAISNASGASTIAQVQEIFTGPPEGYDASGRGPIASLISGETGWINAEIVEVAGATRLDGAGKT
jgi:hypothetical protein